MTGEALLNDYEGEALFRRQVLAALSIAHCTRPPVAEFAEIDMVMRDLRHVPILKSLLADQGLLGGLTPAAIQARQQEKERSLEPFRYKLRNFHDHLRGDERASISLLVRSAAVLTELMRVKAAFKDRVETASLDRWLWLGMREIVDLDTLRLEFRLDKDEEQWLRWTENTDPIGSTVNDTFFATTNIFQLEDMQALLALCPIAASRPLELPMSAEDVLRSGYLAGSFTPHSRDGEYYRARKPIWTASYAGAMVELYGPDQVIPPMPALSTFLPALPADVDYQVTRELLANLYRAAISGYSDGQPEGATMIILQWMKELHSAMINNEYERFMAVYKLRGQWRERGMLDTT